MALAGGGAREASRAAAALKADEPAAPLAVAALCLHVAACAPERLVEVWDGFCQGWQGDSPEADAVVGEGPAGPIPRAAFDALWAIVDDPEAGNDPADITVRTAALAGTFDAALPDRVAAMALRYPGVAEASAQGIPPRFKLEDLSACPRDSLGGALHSLVVDQGFDLEVLDRDELGLQQLPSPLDYLNVRILQCHDVWHEVAGYSTSGLHEICISSFQMAQFGHHYSSTFLAMLMAKAAYTAPAFAAAFIFDPILAAYRHGRESPALLGVQWEAVWAQPIEVIREQLGLGAYDHPYPAGILEERERV